jgi:hypothetical protein
MHQSDGYGDLARSVDAGQPGVPNGERPTARGAFFNLLSNERRLIRGRAPLAVRAVSDERQSLRRSPSCGLIACKHVHAPGTAAARVGHPRWQLLIKVVRWPERRLYSISE